MSLRSAKESANLVSKKMLIGAFHRYQMKCKSVSKKSPRYKNEASCVVFGMPREAINMGGVCEVVDLSQVSQQMLAKISAGQAIRI